MQHVLTVFSSVMPTVDWKRGNLYTYIVFFIYVVFTVYLYSLLVTFYEVLYINEWPFKCNAITLFLDSMLNLAIFKPVIR